MKIHLLTCALALSFAPGAALAENVLPPSHIAALNCVENLDASMTWSQCLNVIFAECATNEVGSEDHLACLGTLQETWVGTLETLGTDAREVITEKGNAELAELLDAWTKFVVQKCEAVALEKAASSADAARLGCEVTEIVGLSGEYVACLEGRSNAPYCERKE
jgi:hypothetical protein